MKQHVIYLGVIILLILILFRAECGRPATKGEDIKVNGKKYELVKREIDTVFVKVKPDVVYKQGKTIYRDTTIYQEIPSLGAMELGDELMHNYYDSILMSHFAKRVFTDTIKFGTNGSVYIKDTLQENAILSRTTNSDLIFPTIKETITVKEKPKNQLYLGAKTILGSSNISGVGTGLMLKTKRDRVYGIGAMIDGQKNVNFTVDFYIKL
jgi:hypothetical protein